MNRLRSSLMLSSRMLLGVFGVIVGTVGGVIFVCLSGLILNLSKTGEIIFFGALGLIGGVVGGYASSREPVELFGVPLGSPTGDVSQRPSSRPGWQYGLAAGLLGGLLVLIFVAVSGGHTPPRNQQTQSSNQSLEMVVFCVRQASVEQSAG